MGEELQNRVYLVETKPTYPQRYDPEERTHLKGALQSLFRAWGRNPENPFEHEVGAGGCVIIKPNWVVDHHPLGCGLDSLITHTSLLSYIVDWAAAALNGEGRIVIGDSPIQRCAFNRMTRATGMDDVIAAARKRYPGVEFLLEDWRLTLLDQGDTSQRSVDDFGRSKSDTHCVVDLGSESFLDEISDYAERFRVTKYKPSLMNARHCKGKHEYLVTKRVFDADLMINVPKLKTHVKAGLTAAMKNLVGINGHKEYLPHHIKGSYFDGGDHYCMPNSLRDRYEQAYDRFWENYSDMPPKKRRAQAFYLKALWRLSRIFGSEGISSGEWCGNETIWRTTLDLNHIVYFGDRRARKVISIVDGIVAGEGDGPLRPSPKPIGVLLCGENPAYVDAVAATIMGYNIARVPTVYHAIYHRKSQFGDAMLSDFAVRRVLPGESPRDLSLEQLPNFAFAKPKYWKRAESIAIGRAA